VKYFQFFAKKDDKDNRQAKQTQIQHPLQYGRKVAGQGIFDVLFSTGEQASSYLLIEGIVIYFLYFEFIALIVK
jgi:hypothetical protein